MKKKYEEIRCGRSWTAACNLLSEITDEHSEACYSDPMRALILFDLIGDARRIFTKLDEIKTIKNEQGEKTP